MGCAVAKLCGSPQRTELPCEQKGTGGGNESLCPGNPLMYNGNYSVNDRNSNWRKPKI